MRYAIFTPLVLLLLSLSLVTAQAQTPAQQLEIAANAARVSAGASSLPVDSRLEAAAQSKINYMISSGCFLPRCVNEPDWYARQAGAGFPVGSIASELLDTDHTVVSEVVSYWMTEGSGSRFLLTLGLFTHIGCATGTSGSTPLWVCDLGQATNLPTATPVPPTPTPGGAPISDCWHLWKDPATGGWELITTTETRASCLS